MYSYDIFIKTENGLESLDKNSSGTIEIMKGAGDESDGKEGLVPAPTSTDKNKYLKGDGSWDDIEFANKAEQDGSGNNIIDTYAKKSLYDDTNINIGRENNTKIGEYSCAIGYSTQATEESAYAEGIWTIASGICSHAEGYSTTASGNRSHTEGSNTKAQGMMTHAEGSLTIAERDYSHAEGLYTISNNYCSHACGKYNVAMEVGSLSNSNGTAFVIGSGYDGSNRSNAFSVKFDGTTKASSTITAETTADYAEFFEWDDGNPNKEDRVGKFVTLYGDKISIATSNEDYILGIISGTPFVLGNGDCDVWTGMWLRDEFNRIIYEPAPKLEVDEETGVMKEVFDGDGNLVYEGVRKKLNPNYDSTQKYVSRFDRSEWSPVGMLGVLSVIQDGTCEVDGYCCCNKNGIATFCDKDTDNSYRVIDVISNHVVKIVFK